MTVFSAQITRRLATEKNISPAWGETLLDWVSRYRGFWSDLHCLHNPVEMEDLWRIISSKKRWNSDEDLLNAVVSEFNGWFWCAIRGKERWNSLDESYCDFRNRVGAPTDGVHLEIFDIPHVHPNCAKIWLLDLLTLYEAGYKTK